VQAHGSLLQLLPQAALAHFVLFRLALGVSLQPLQV